MCGGVSVHTHTRASIAQMSFTLTPWKHRLNHNPKNSTAAQEARLSCDEHHLLVINQK